MLGILFAVMKSSCNAGFLAPEAELLSPCQAAEEPLGSLDKAAHSLNPHRPGAGMRVTWDACTD